MASKLSIARPYAKAAFEIALVNNDLAKWSDMLENASLIVSDNQVQDLIKNPSFSREKLQDLVIELGQDSFNDEMKGLIKLLSRFKRLTFFPEIAQLYQQLRDAKERIAKVELVSAFTVTEAEKERFMTALKQKLNHNIEIECKTDNSILGGAIIQTGDWVIDGSLRGKLNKLYDAMGLF